MKRWYLVWWKSHGQYPTHDRHLAADAREAARRFLSYCPRTIDAVVVEASGERVASELWS